MTKKIDQTYILNITATQKKASPAFIKMLGEELAVEKKSFKDEDFSNKKINSFVSVNCHFKNCKFENLKLDDLCFGAGMKMSTYSNCSFDNSTFHSRVVGRARFENCSFQNVNIKMFFAHDAEFINCKFSGKLKKALFYGKLIDQERRDELGREYNEIIGNDFSKLEMDDVDFRDGVDLSKQKLPQGNGYLYIEKPFAMLQQAKLVIRNWSDQKIKRKAEIKLTILEEKFNEGQTQFFLIKKDMEPKLFDLFYELSHSLT